MAETERQLTEAIREGDRAALRRLYERYVRYGMAIALRIVADEEDALDVVHNAFVSILTSIDTFDYRGEGSLKAWVARIVTNKSLSWLKDNDKLQLTDQLPEEPANDDDAPIEAVPPNVLNTMISRLPKANRIVVNLHVFGEMTHNEIGQELGISAKTSMAYFSRAKQMLSKMIKEYLNAQGI